MNASQPAPSRRRDRKFLGQGGIAAGAVLAFGLCLWTPQAPARADTAPEQPFAMSLSGNYLAGRFAGGQRENEAAAAYYLRALEDDPENAYILEHAFLLEVSSGDFENATKLAGNLLEHDPNHRIGNAVLGLADVRAKRYAEARKHFEAAHRGSIGQLISALLTAWAYQAEARTDDAIKALESISDTDTFGIFGPFHAALINDFAGRNKAAAEGYARSYEALGSSLRLVQAYGNFLERTGKPEEAARIYEAFLSGSPEQPLILSALERNRAGEVPKRMIASGAQGMGEALFGVASAVADESRIDVALIYIQMTLFAHPDLIIGRSLLGDIYTEMNQRELAIESYESVPEDSPLRRNAEIHIADNLDKLDKVEAARAILTSLIGKNPRDELPLTVMGNLLRNREKFLEAAEYYARAIELIEKVEQRHWRLFYSRGIAYERSKQWPKAEKDFKKALELFPDQPLVLNYLGYSWVEKGLHLQEAMEMIRKAVKLRPNDGYIVDSLGWAHYRMKQYEEAVRYLEQAVELRPDDPTINDHLGDALWRVGRKLEARFQWNHAKKLKPEPENLEKIEHKIEHGMEPEEPGKETSASSSQDKS